MRLYSTAHLIWQSNQKEAALLRACGCQKPYSLPASKFSSIASSMIPLKEESRASSSDENTSLLDDDDSIADTDDDEEENSLAVRVGGGLSIETQQPCGQGPQQPAPSAMIDSNTSHRNRVSTATPQKYRPPARIVSSSSSGQLSFDMNQPWERSLARQLDQLGTLPRRKFLIKQRV